jgi:hypothetical protein
MVLGLDNFTYSIDGYPLLNDRTNPIAQQMTRNVLARFGASHWTAVDDAPGITAMVSHKDSLFATTSLPTTGYGSEVRLARTLATTGSTAERLVA